MADKSEIYAAKIYRILNSMFDEDSENHEFDMNEIDGTALVTGLVKASALFVNNHMGQNKNFLEFTHLANQLIVQDMLENKDDVA